MAMLGDPPRGTALKRERDRFVGFAFAAADTLIELDAAHRVCYAAGSSLGKGDMIGRPVEDLLAARDRDGVVAALGRAAQGGRVPAMTVRLDGVGHGPGAHVLSGWCLPDLEGHFFLALRPEPAGDPQVSPTPDAETGLPDGSGFRGAVARALAQDGTTGTMTLVDLDGLNAVCDRLRAEETAVLMERIGATLRSSAINGSLVGRTGEQGFGLVHDAALDAEHLAQALGELILAADPSAEGVRVRRGSVVLDGAAVTSEEAEEAVLYAIRKFGESKQGMVKLGTMSECCASMAREHVQRLARFKRTVSTDEFSTVVQPIVEIGTGAIKHFELLSRFGNVDEGSPQTMIAFAEEVGVICDFDLRVIARSLLAIDEADQAGSPALNLAVNLSMRSVERPDFIEALGELFVGRPEKRSRIIFEITETARIEDTRAANNAVQALRRAGHKVCLDDFGAGAASFQYLKALEVDAIKIDGAYVTRALGSRRNRAFLKAMAGFCLEMDVEVVGEMVEDENTARFLETCGIRYGQGFYFGRPQTLGTYLARARVESLRKAVHRQSRHILTVD
jgi:EAL domain-containing protein (putative c-di-GMP-specific phosphodiesterase class I)/GGDEF domain-containing protein